MSLTERLWHQSVCRLGPSSESSARLVAVDRRSATGSGSEVATSLRLCATRHPQGSTVAVLSGIVKPFRPKLLVVGDMTRLVNLSRWQVPNQWRMSSPPAELEVPVYSVLLLCRIRWHQLRELFSVLHGRVAIFAPGFVLFDLRVAW